MQGWESLAVARHLLAQEAEHMSNVPLVFLADGGRRRRVECGKDGLVHPQQHAQCHRQNARLVALIPAARKVGMGFGMGILSRIWYCPI